MNPDIRIPCAVDALSEMLAGPDPWRPFLF
jgi:hypothetical protein